MERITNERAAEISEFESRESKLMPELEALRIPIQNILLQISPNIERGEYSLIIGDDASGRIPALIMGNAIKGLYKERVFEKPEVLFVAGGRGDERLVLKKRKNVFDHICATKKRLEHSRQTALNKALIVTEDISTGSTISPLVEAVENNNIQFDVVSVRITAESGGFLNRLKSDSLRSRLKYGEVDPRPPMVYAKSHLSGVRKKHTDIFSYPYKKDLDSEKEKKEAQQTINETRRQIKILSRELVDWYNNALAQIK